MSKRTDIIDPARELGAPVGLVYSEILGWSDLGHALGRSGFSAEDLVSDLLGFYRVIRPMDYFPQLRLVSKEEALKRWDHYGEVGRYKNRLFRPLLFPDPVKNRNASPYYGELPRFMKAVQPYNDFTRDTVKVISNNGVLMNIGKEPLDKFR